MDRPAVAGADLNVFNKPRTPPGGIMGAVLTYVIYLLISIGLTTGVGWALARSGRTFLREVFDGNDGLAEAVDRLLVVGFYLLNLGFVTLTMATPATVDGARQGLQILSVKIGEVLLVLGVLHFANLAVFARIRGRAQGRGLLAHGADGLE